MLTSFKKYLLWFIIGLSLIWSVSYAANNGSIWALFIDIAWNWKLMWDDVQDSTIDTSEIQDNSIVSADIQNESIEWIDIKDGTIEAADLAEIYINSTWTSLDSEMLDWLDSTDFYTQVWNIQITSTWISTNIIELDEIILWGVSITGALLTPPSVCTDNVWSPSSAETCSGIFFTQTSNCWATKTGIWIKTCPGPSNTNLVIGVPKIAVTAGAKIDSMMYGKFQIKVGCIDVDVTCTVWWTCMIWWNTIGMTDNPFYLDSVTVFNETSTITPWQAATSSIHTSSDTGAEFTCVVKWDTADNMIKVYWNVESTTWTYNTYQKEWDVANAVAWYILD